MKKHLRRLVFFAAVTVTIFSAAPCFPMTKIYAPETDVSQLRILTINLLFSEVKERETRLRIIADYLADEYDTGTPVDVVFLQEVVGGKLSGTLNSALDLKNLLDESGMQYFLRYRMEEGLPGLLTVGNAVLSRHEIRFTLSRMLPFASEVIFDNVRIPIRRNAMMCRIRVPGIGFINLYNTHLCAFCEGGVRLVQTEELLDFVSDAERLFWKTDAVILGGDFNTNLNLAGDCTAYDAVTAAGFDDTYDLIHGCGVLPDCCCPENGCMEPGSRGDDDACLCGCTYGVDGNPYAVNIFSCLPIQPERIDFIFLKKGSRVEADSSRVIFNTENNFVSDHSGLLTDFVPLGPPGD
jgi:maltose 6'-phosphate phosphatase